MLPRGELYINGIKEWRQSLSSKEMYKLNSFDSSSSLFTILKSLVPYDVIERYSVS